MSDLNKIEEAYEDGYEACLNGQSRHSNPYADERARYWREGFADAEFQMVADLDNE